MSKDLNKVQIIGRLGADPDMRYTPQGTAIVQFSVASGRSWKSADGTQNEETEWFTVDAWDKLGEICGKYLVKGTRVYIEGRLKTESWEDKATGEKKYRTKVIAADMIILSSKADSGDTTDTATPTKAPTRQPATRNVPQATNDSDEGLPF